jgi:hypothetical protein
VTEWSAFLPRGSARRALGFPRTATQSLKAWLIMGGVQVVMVVIDPAEYEAYHGRWPEHLFFLLGESDRGIGYARDQFKRFAQGGMALHDSTPLALPFYYEIDDLLYHLRGISAATEILNWLRFTYVFQDW